MSCEECAHVKNKVDKRLKELEINKVIQGEKNDTTNIILKEIKDSLNKIFSEIKDDLKEQQTTVNELMIKMAVEENQTQHQTLTNANQREINFKAIGWLIGLIGTFLTIISSIIFA